MIITYLIFFWLILKDVLDDQTSSFPKCHVRPHAFQCRVDVFHDLRRIVVPSELEKFLPDMAGIAVNDRFWYTAE